MAFAAPAAAQLAPSARPTGGQVSAGQATIGGAGNTTLISQSSQNAIINWQSYNVGSAQTVRYAQPDAGALTLNRVTGANPSEIAGRIQANGQIILVNQSGVVFDRGSQVDTAGLVVSASGISNRNFLAGRMVFDQAPHPGATVSNAGNITVRQAGLAALVAPQVANSGVITAQLGHVVLAGGEAATLDLYGDRLVSLNVTKAVHAVSLNGQAVQALVTNSGTILAPGGKVVLTARDADGVVTDLVEAGGAIAADTLGRRRGTVLVSGVGGSVEIDGSVSASGTAAGSLGGRIGINATDTVTLASNAVVNASGDAGGGIVAIGTGLQRAQHGSGVGRHAARNVVVAQGASVSANAVTSGNGGDITVLSQVNTVQAGAISARGGAAGGNGGRIELSGAGVLTISGTENAGASKGGAGMVLIDPEYVEITNGAPDPGYTAITTAAVDGMTGDVVIIAGNTLKVLSNVDLGSGATGFDLAAGNLLVLSADWNAHGLSGTFSAGAGGIQQTAGIVTAGSLDLEATGAVVQTGGSLDVGTLLGNVGSGNLTQQANVVGTLGALTTAGNFALTTGSDLAVGGGVIGGGNVTLTAKSIDIADTLEASGTLGLFATGGDIVESGQGQIFAGVLTGSATGSVNLATANNGFGTVDGFTAGGGGIVLIDSESLALAGTIAATGAVTVGVTGSGGGGDQGSGNSLAVAGSVTGQSVSLAADGQISEAAGALVQATGGGLTLAAGAGIDIAGMLESGTLTAGGLSNGGAVSLVAIADVTEAASGTLASATLVGTVGGSLSLAANSNRVAAVGNLTTGGDFLLASLTAPDFSGVVGVGGALSSTVPAGGGVTRLSGTITAGTATIISPDGILQTGGSLSTGTGTLALVASGGAIGQSAGVLDAGTTLILTADSISFGGSLVGADIALTAIAGGIVEAPAGVVSAPAGTLTANASGPVDLGSLGNSFAVLGASHADTAFTLDDATGLTIAGATTAAGAIDIASLGSALTVDATVQSTGGAAIALSGEALLVNAGGSVVSTGGSIRLQANRFALGGPVTTGITGVVAFDLLTPGTLSLTGLESDTFSGNGLGQVTTGQIDLGVPNTQTVSAILISQVLDVTNAATLGLFAGSGGILVTAPLTVDALTGATTGNFAADFAGVANTITLLGSFVTGGDFALDDAVSLQVAGGALVGGGSGGLAIDVQHGSLTLGTASNSATLTAAQTVTLQADGSIVQNGGLVGSTGNGVQPGAADLVLVANTGSIAFSGELSGAALLLSAAGGIAETAFGGGAVTGSIVAGTLAAVAGAEIGLDGTGNSIANVAALASPAFGLSAAGLTATAGLSLVDDRSLTLDQALVTAESGIDISLIAGGATVGTLTQTGGSIASGGAGSDVTLQALDVLQAYASITAPGLLHVAGGGLTQTASTVFAGSVTVDGGVSQFATSLIQSAGGITIGGVAAQTNSAIVASGGDIVVGTGIDQIDSALTASGFVVVTGGGVTQAGASSIVGSAGVTLALAGSLQQGAGGLIMTPGGVLVVESAGGSIAIGGTMQAGMLAAGGYGGVMLLSAGGGDIAEAAGGSGRILAGTLAALASGSILLDPAAARAQNVIGVIGGLAATVPAYGTLALQGLRAGGDVQLADGVGLTIADGAVVDAAQGGIVIVTQGAAAPGLTVGTSGGATLLAGQTISLQAGTIVQNGGVIASATGDVSLTALDGGIAFDGLIQGGGAIGAGGAFAAAGSSTILLQAAGDVTEGGAGGRILAGTLDANAGGQILLAAAGATIATGNQVFGIGAQGLVANGGDIDLTDQASLAVQGPVVSAGNIDIAVGGAGLGLSLDPGAGVHAAGGVNLSASGDLNMSGGTVLADQGAVTLTAGGSFDQSGGSIQAAAGVGIDALGSIGLAGLVSTPGAVSLQAGSIEGTGSIDAAILAANASGGGIALDGTNLIGAIGTSGGLTGLTATGAISLADVEGLAIDADIVSAGSSVSVAGSSTVEEAQGVAMAAATALQITAPTSITINGMLSAPTIVLGNAATGSVVWNDNTILTDASAGGPRGFPQVLPDTGLGVFVNAANFQQNGTATIEPLSGGGRALLQVTIEGQGVADFNNLQAPAADLLLVLLNGGSAAGTINVASLDIYHPAGEASIVPTMLSGEVGDFTGTAAAGAGFSHSGANVDYQLNGCAVASLNCVLLSPISVPVVDPVSDYYVGTTHRRHDDDDALPNVAETDY